MIPLFEPCIDERGDYCDEHGRWRIYAVGHWDYGYELYFDGKKVDRFRTMLDAEHYAKAAGCEGPWSDDGGL